MSSAEQLVRERFSARHPEVLRFLDYPWLSPADKTKLIEHLLTVDVDYADAVFDTTVSGAGSTASSASAAHHQLGDSIAPLSVSRLEDMSAETLAEHRTRGLELIRRGQVGVIVLGGGQGTRLGTDAPKGLYDVGLPSHRSLFQLQGERILRLLRLADADAGKLPWYVMTSDATDAETREYFASMDYFGFGADNVIFFSQPSAPCMTTEGAFLLDTPTSLAFAPDGNGGIYKSLLDSGTLLDMERRGVEYLHIYCVDNILSKPADPVFMALCVDSGADAGAKVVPKRDADERVGVFCTRDNKVSVIEYSEMPRELSHAVDAETGRLRYNTGNIANHFATRQFLQHAASWTREAKRFHIARKKIPYIDESGHRVDPPRENGIKFEQFIFDVFESCAPSKFLTLEVAREEEFSPPKNNDSQPSDNPTTCRQHLSALHRRWAECAGCTVSGHDAFEIAPAVTYDGEDLEWMLGKSFNTPVCVEANEVDK